MRAAVAIVSSRSGSASSARADPRRGGRRRTRRRAPATAAPASTIASALRGLVVAGRARERHEHRRDAGGGELGHGDRAGPAHRERRAGVQRLHVVFVAHELVLKPVSGTSRGRDERAAHVARSRDAPVTWRTATSARSRQRSYRSRAASLSRPAPRLPPKTATSGGVVRARARRPRSRRRIGLPVRTAPRSGVPGSEIAARAPRRTATRLARPGAAFCSCTTAGTSPQARRHEARQRRVAPDADHDPRPRPPHDAAGARERSERSHHGARGSRASRRRWRPRPGSRSIAYPASGTTRASSPRRAPTNRIASARVPARRRARRPARGPGTRGRRSRRR